MTGRRNAQKKRVYAWEDRVVAPADRSTLPFSAAQGMVDAIWSELGLRYPPKVEPLPRQARRLQADGSRLRLRLPETVRGRKAQKLSPRRALAGSSGVATRT